MTLDDTKCEPPVCCSFVGQVEPSGRSRHEQTRAHWMRVPLRFGCARGFNSRLAAWPCARSCSALLGGPGSRGRGCGERSSDCSQEHDVILNITRRHLAVNLRVVVRPVCLAECRRRGRRCIGTGALSDLVILRPEILRFARPLDQVFDGSATSKPPDLCSAPAVLARSTGRFPTA